MVIASGWLAAMSAAGCVDPQSGAVTRGWCKAVDTQAVLVLDDMEDGDGAACEKKGRWSVRGMGVLRPTVGPLGEAANLEGDDLVKRAPSVRAMHLSAELEAGGWISLFLALDSENLSQFVEIQVWGRSDAGDLTLRANVATVATTEIAQGGTCDPGLGACGDHFGEPSFELSETWGATGNPNSIALMGITQVGFGQAVPRDFTQTLGIEFRFTGPADAATPTFGFWIDDVQVKGAPPQ